MAAPASAATPREPLWGVIAVAYGSYSVDYGQDRPTPPSGIDGLTLVAWRAVGLPRFFHRWWARESPGYRVIELGARVARLDARTRNQIKLVLAGQFAFLARRP